MKKKFLALVMTLSMVLSLVPMTALATGDGSTAQTTTTAESQTTGDDANGSNQEGGSNADSDSTPTGESSTNKDPGANPENKGEGKDNESESTGAPSKPESGGTPSGGGAGGSPTTEPTESEKPEVPKYAAKIGDTPYKTLDEAIEAAKDGATIELLQDVTLTKTFSKSLTFTGGHAINFNVYGWRYTGDLVLDGAHLNIINDESSRQADNGEAYRWFTMCLTGSITAKNEAGISFVIDSDSGANCAIYMDENAQATINVENGSKFSITGENTKGILGQGIQLGNTENTGIYVSGNSKFLIDGTNRGYVNSPEIKVEDSTFTVRNCTANASNGGKFVAINSDVNFIDNAGHGLSAGNLTIDNSNVTANGNGANGIHTTGTLNICNKSNVEIKNNKCSISSKWTIPGAVYMAGTESKIEDSTLVIQDNLGSGIYQKNKNGTLTIADNATVSIMKNKAEKLGFGGGIYVNGTANISKNVELYNNHAEQAGDDIYNTGTITFGAVGNDWILDDCASIDNCNGKIYGWYDDSVGKRWNAHDKENRHIQEYDPIEGKFKENTVTEDSSATQAATDALVVEIAPLALKAAHPLMFKVDYVVDGECPDVYTKPEKAYYPADSMYTIESVPSSIPGTKDGVNGTYSFTGWKTKNGDFVTGQQALKEDTTLYGKWTFTKKSSSGGHRPSNPPVTIPDDVPTGLDLKNHYGYIIGYPVDYYTGKPTTDQTKKPVRPEGKITRAEVATIYFRMLTDENRAANWNQVSGFSDVKSSAWYNNAISTLTKAGILKGYEDGTFQPNGYITRAEFATIAIRFFSGVYEGEDLFPDIKGHWAEDYINNAANKGLVKGYEDGTFGPDRYITRAEAVTLVNRTLNRHPHNDGLHKDMLVWPDNMDTSKWYYADMQEATNSHEPDKNKSTADKEYWGKMLPIRDWEALEKEWSNANSAPGEGEVV